MRKKLLLTLIIALFISVFVGCGGASASLELDKSSLSLNLFAETEITATVSGTEEALTFENSSPDVIDLTQDGKVAKIVAKKEGIATVTAKCGGLTKECTIAVSPTTEKIVLSTPWTDSIELIKNGTLVLSAKASFGGNELENATIKCQVADSSIATVENGVIKALSVGETTLTVSAEYFDVSSNSVILDVVVKEDVVMNVNASSVSVYLENDYEEFSSEFALEVSMIDGASSSEVEYTAESKNTDIVTIDNGVITAQAIGNTVVEITCSYKNVEYTANVNVSVKGIISFNSNGGTDLEPITFAKGSAVKIPNSPTRKDYVFDGWYKDANCSDGNYFSFTSDIDSNVTAYARWYMTDAMKETVFQREGKATLSAGVLTPINSSSSSYEAVAMTGSDARNGTYIYKNTVENGADGRKLKANVTLSGMLLVGNYMVIDFYIAQLTEGLGNFLKSGGESSYTFYEGTTKVSTLETGKWYRGVMKILDLKDPNYCDYVLYICDWGKTECYISGVSFYTTEAKIAEFGMSADEQFKETGIYTCSASVLSLTNTNLSTNANTTYVLATMTGANAKENVYKHTTDGDSYDKRKMQIATTAFSGNYVVGNYVVIEFYIESAGSLYGGFVQLVDSGKMAIYDSEKNVVADKAEQTGKWYKAVGKINTLNGGVYDDDNIAISHYTTSTTYIASVSVYTAEAAATEFGITE